MLDRITQPEKFIDAERAGADWIKAQKKEHAGFAEVVKSFFSFKSTDHDPISNVLFKSVGITAIGASGYLAQFLGNVSRPEAIGTALLAVGAWGAFMTYDATKDSLDRRKIERERKAARVAS